MTDKLQLCRDIPIIYPTAPRCIEKSREPFLTNSEFDKRAATHTPSPPGQERQSPTYGDRWRSHCRGHRFFLGWRDGREDEARGLPRRQGGPSLGGGRIGGPADQVSKSASQQETDSAM